MTRFAKARLFVSGSEHRQGGRNWLDLDDDYEDDISMHVRKGG
jgi:hypothetical protein